MRWLSIIAVLVAAAPVLENPRVRAYRSIDGSLSGVAHGPGVVISISDAPGVKAGHAVWVEDAAVSSPTVHSPGSIVIVQPLHSAAAVPQPSNGSKPGEASFTGMSFKPMFENNRVSVIRARMEVGAREGFHTHGSDTIVVHLSGGEIEDTAAGKTVVNRWRPGDVEFESLGSSHSARNVGGAVDVVLVALKPQ